MNESLSLKKDFIRKPIKEPATGVGVQGAIIQDTDIAENDALKRFYFQHYHEDYILADQTFFQWMFRNNGGRVATLMKDGDVIAHQGHVPVVFTDGQHDYRSFISASTMTGEGYRRKGLMSFLRGNVQDRYDMAVSIGGSPLGVKLYSSMGYKLCGILHRAVGVVDVERAKQVSKHTEKLKQTVSVFDEENPSARPIETFSVISRELDMLRDRIFTKKGYFRVKRDAEFLDWRYTDHPYFDYRRFGLWDGDELRAVLVFRREHIQDDLYTIRIVEVIGEKDDVTTLAKASLLHREMIKDVAWIDWYCSSRPISKILESVGLLHEDDWEPVIFPHYCSPVDYYKKEYPVMFWAKNDALFAVPPSNLEQWYVTKGDGDADRPNRGGVRKV